MILCNYFGCPLKDKCKRFSAVVQSDYYTNPSYFDKGKFVCDKYIGSPEHYLYEQLQSIFRNRKRRNP